MGEITPATKGRKWNPWALVLAVVLGVGGLGVGHSAGQEAGYQAGEAAGHDAGVTEGYNKGYNKGHTEGKDQGYSDGYAEGKAEGYDSGYQAGHRDGKEEGKEEGRKAAEAELKAAEAKPDTPAKDTSSSEDRGGSATAYDYIPSSKSGSGGSDSNNSNDNTGGTSTDSVTVYVTRTGEKYHSYGCRYLRKSCIEISLSSAKSQGYEPCSVCHPPR